MPSSDPRVVLAGAPRKPPNEIKLHYIMGRDTIDEEMFLSSSDDVFGQKIATKVQEAIKKRFSALSPAFRFLAYDVFDNEIDIYIDAADSQMRDDVESKITATTLVAGTRFPNYFGIGYKQYTRVLATEAALSATNGVLREATTSLAQIDADIFPKVPALELTKMNAFTKRLMDDKVLSNQYLYHGSPVQLVTGFTTNACYLTPDVEEARGLAGPQGYVYKYRPKRTEVVMLEVPTTTMNDGGELVYWNSFLEGEWENAQVQRLAPLLETDNLAHLLMMYTPAYGVFYRKERVFHMFPPFDSTLNVVSEENEGQETVFSKEVLKLRAAQKDRLELIPHAFALDVELVDLLARNAGVRVRSLAVQKMFNMYSPDIVLDVDKFVDTVQKIMQYGVDGTGLTLYYKSAQRDGNEKTVEALRELPISLFFDANYEIVDYNEDSESSE
jgi:hypothetical protein